MTRMLSFLTTVALAVMCSPALSQRVPDPASFLGYEPGQAFTYHYRMVDYFEAVAAASDRVKLIPYGQSNERRPLFVAVLSSAENLKKIESIRLNNLRLTGLVPGTPTEKPIPIVWLGYNIHGNEAVSLEAAMVTLYKLVAQDTAHWLDEVVVIIDPCINPDGRDRYANWYNQVWTNPITYNRDGLEHHEPWPGGRFNHYLFDLNRDWCWQSQAESEQRARLYHQWMPHVVVDFHEMGAESSYFFGPAAKPIHDLVSDWQMEFQEKVGDNNARYFDRAGWLFFTREVYDMLYPSYGDSWSTFNGAVGFTYEQGGSSRAGVGLTLELGDTLTLTDRMTHHITTGLSTVETSVRNSKKLIDEFGRYFATAREGKINTPYKAYLLRPSSDPDALPALLNLLAKQQISWYQPAVSSKSFSGYDYHTQRSANVKVVPGDVVVSLSQPNARMAQAILEPNTYLEDSLTYDLTAWSLPYAFDIPAWGLQDAPAMGETSTKTEDATDYLNQPASFGYAVSWKGVQDARFLARALSLGIKPRFSELPLTSGKYTLDAGTLVFTRTDNSSADFPQNLFALAESFDEELIPVNGALSTAGNELGSSSFHLLRMPKVALIGGKGVSATAYGEIWFYLEKTLGMKVELLSTEYLSSVWLDQYQVVILPDGSYSAFQDQLLTYARNGGKIIAIEEAITLFAQAGKEDKYLTKLGQALHAPAKTKGQDNPAMFLDDDGEFSYENRERQDLKQEAVGCIMEVKLDFTHPLAFGQDSVYYQIKRRRAVYPMLPDGCWNVGVFERSEPISGFMGSEMKKRVGGTLAFGIENYGKGDLVYFAESPVTRGFWRSGELLLANAIFLRW